MDFLSNIFGGLKNLLGGAAQGAGNLLGGVGNAIGGAAKSAGSLFGGSNPMSMSGGGQSQAAAPAISGAKNMTNAIGAPGAFMPSKSMAGSLPGFSSTSSPNKQKGILDQLFPGGSTPGIAGLAAPAIGNLFAPKTPNIPNFGDLSSVQAMQNFRPGNSTSPEYQKMIQDNVGQLRDQQIRELQATYHNARPGTDYTTDSNYQRDLALLNQNSQDSLTDELAKAEGTFSSQEQDRLSQLAQMDIYSIMAQTGMKSQEAQQFKEMFGNIGNTFLTQATKKPDDLSSIMALFGGH